MKLRTRKPVVGLYEVVHHTNWSETTYHIKAKNGPSAIRKLVAYFERIHIPYKRDRITAGRVYETDTDIIETKDDTWGD